MSFAQLLLESNGAIISKVAGVAYDPKAEELVFKVAHHIPKEDVRRVATSGDLPPVEQPFQALDMDELKRRFRTDDFDNAEIEDVISFMANMPGGGAQWLVGKGTDTNLDPGRRSIDRVQLQELYDELMAALWRKTYREHYDPENHTMVPRTTKVKADELGDRPVTCGHPECFETARQYPSTWNRRGCPHDTTRNPENDELVDMEAWQLAEVACLKALKRITHNQPKHFGGDWRTGRGSPHGRVHRAKVSAALTEHYLEKARQDTFTAVREFIPRELQSIFLENARYSGDDDSTSFTALTPHERRSSQARQLKIQKGVAASERMKRHAMKKDELAEALAELVDSDFEENPEDAFDIPVYILYTELDLPTADIVIHLANHFMKSLKAGFVKRISSEYQDQHDEPITTLMWNTGIDSLSLFADKADTLSFHVMEKTNEVVSPKTQRMWNRTDPDWDNPTAIEGKRRGLMTRVLQGAIRTAFTRSPPEGGGKTLPADWPVIHDVISGPLVVFSVPQAAL